MKNLSFRSIAIAGILTISGLCSSYVLINAVAAISSIILIIIFHLENVQFCKKIDRVLAGEKNIQF